MTLVLVVRVDLRGGILPKPRRSVGEIADRTRDRLHTCIQRVENNDDLDDTCNENDEVVNLHSIDSWPGSSP